jgi:MFS family permease
MSAESTLVAVAEKPLFRNRDFQALWSGQFFGAVAKESAEIAYPLLILATTGSATYAGAVGATQLAVAAAMSLPGGSLTDRFDRKKIMIACDLTRLVLLVIFGFLVLAHSISIVAVFAVVAASAACLGISNPAGLAAIKQLVPPSQLSQATAQNQIRFFAATVIGPPIGGFLFAIAWALPFLISAVAFLIAGALLLLIRRPTQAAHVATKSGSGGKGGILEGWRAVVKEPIILILVIWAAGSNMTFNHSGIFLALIATAHERGASDALVGATVAVAGAGGLTGALLAAPILKYIRPRAILYYAVWIGPVAAVLMAVIPSVLPLGVVVACIFLRAGVTGALIFGYIAALIPDGVQGRVIGVVMFISMVAQPIGIFAVGAIFDLAGPSWVFISMAIAGTLVAIPTLSKSIRHLPRPEELAAARQEEPA